MSLTALYDQLAYWRDELDAARMNHDFARLKACAAIVDALLRFRAETWGYAA